jgi:hypothetical protein
MTRRVLAIGASAAIALLSSSAVASQTYPTPADGAIAGIQMAFTPTVCTCAPLPLGPDQGWFRLRNDIPNGTSGTGGYVRVMGYDFGPSTFEVLDDAFTYYRIGYSHTSHFEDLPGEVKNAWQVRVVLTVTPTYVPIGASPLGQFEQVRPYPSTSDVIIDLYDQVWPAMSPPSGEQANQRSWVINVGERPDWIDAEISIRIEVTPDPSILYSSFWQGTYVWTMVFPLRQQSYPYAYLTPYFMPTAIIGQPPGDQSWSRLTQSSGAGATVGVMETQSTTRTHSRSAGLGLITKTTPTYTETHTDEQGTFHTISQTFSLGLQTNTPYGVGRGDILVGMKAPTFEIYEAPEDLDFRILHAGQDVAFPFEALFAPGTNSFVDQMTPDEIQALIDLNPLASNPHARLEEPRYFHVKTFASLQGALLNGQYFTDSITSIEVENKLLQTLWEDQSFSLEIPFAAIIKAATGYSVPEELIDAYARVDETTSATYTYANTTTTNNASGSVVEFQIGSSDPREEICVAIYWDSFFRTYAFRDCKTPPIHKWLDSITGTYKLHDKPMPTWLAAIVEKDAKHPWIIGFLGDDAQAEKGAMTFRAKDGGIEYAAAVTRAGNVVIPEMQPGTYFVNVGKSRYMLELSENHQVTYKWVGTSGNTAKDEQGRK